jgi:signal transduction histidine kinase
MAVARKRKDARQLVLLQDMPAPVAATYDLRDATALGLVVDALTAILRTGDRAIRVVGGPGMHEPGRWGATGVEFVEIVIGERPLVTSMRAFGWRILWLSIAISLFVAALIYLALNALTVRPIERLVRAMQRFEENPEDASRIVAPSGRTDEIGTAERELQRMQMQLSQTLQQRSRLAALGLAVSKISHDLRNMLASAQLISDRFQDVQDPTVQRFAPKLISSLDRAIKLCADTLAFGRAEEALPRRNAFPLRALAEEVGEGLGLVGTTRANKGSHVDWQLAMPPELVVEADRDQLYRVLSNLGRNALQALETTGRGGTIRVAAEASNGSVRIDVLDDGPGLPERARHYLFEPFHGSSRKGGTGLGLAIAAELVRAHGGSISLLESDTGAHFRIELPLPGDSRREPAASRPLAAGSAGE